MVRLVSRHFKRLTCINNCQVSGAKREREYNAETLCSVRSKTDQDWKFEDTSYRYWPEELQKTVESSEGHIGTPRNTNSLKTNRFPHRLTPYCQACLSGTFRHVTPTHQSEHRTEQISQ